MAKTLETSRDWRTYWNSVGDRANSEDLFKQVDRTVSGRAVESGELQLLIEAVLRGVQLAPQDVLLDLCCGNGLITREFAPHCQAVVGIDYSDYLIGVARQNTSAGNVSYLVSSAEDLDALDFGVRRPNKVSINGGMQHFSMAVFDRILASLSRRDQPATDIVCTEVPDADRVYAFYNTPERREDFQRRLKAGSEAVGTWWDRDELTAIFDRHGYDATFPPPDRRRLTNHYRFDVVARLRPAGR